MDVPLTIAGSLALITAGIHAAGGEAVMRKLSPEGVALVAAASTGFAALALALGSAYRALTRHLAPAILTATAALAWWGVL